MISSQTDIILALIVFILLFILNAGVAGLFESKPMGVRGYMLNKYKKWTMPMAIFFLIPPVSILFCVGGVVKHACKELRNEILSIDYFNTKEGE